ncbi:MAG: flagellar motor switch protein FliM [Candidatus Latescibacteria bacterium]|nr:flagellar motor switch protein FliM [Candidatus Latescibacterota bacterium]
MPDILSQDEIDALLTSVGTSESHATQSQKVACMQPVVTYDFKHPNRVSKDQIRTLENLHGNLSRLLASSFSSLQRAVIETDIAFVDQTTYAEFIMSLSNPSCSYVFTIEPLGGPAILDFSLPVAYSFIDRQFGGKGTTPMGESRTLTSIERSVMSKVVQRTMEDLEATWEALLKIQISDAELETNPEFMQVAAPSDTMILIAFEVNSQHASGLVNLCYPFFTLEPVMKLLNPKTWVNREKGRRESEREHRLAQLAGVKAPVRAVLGKVEIPFGDVLNLRVGDVVKLDTEIKDPTVVFVGSKPKFLGHPGLSGRHRAVRITTQILKEDEYLYD